MWQRYPSLDEAVLRCVASCFFGDAGICAAHEASFLPCRKGLICCVRPQILRWLTGCYVVLGDVGRSRHVSLVIGVGPMVGDAVVCVAARWYE